MSIISWSQRDALLLTISSSGFTCVNFHHPVNYSLISLTNVCPLWRVTRSIHNGHRTAQELNDRHQRHSAAQDRLPLTQLRRSLDSELHGPSWVREIRALNWMHFGCLIFRVRSEAEGSHKGWRKRKENVARSMPDWPNSRDLCWPRVVLPGSLILRSRCSFKTPVSWRLEGHPLGFSTSARRDGQQQCCLVSR